MTATYTFDVFSSLDGFGAHTGDWGGYWGKQGPELLARRLTQYDRPQHMIFGATTFRDFADMFAALGEAAMDPWAPRMWSHPATVLSNTLTTTRNRPHTTIATGDAVEVITRLKNESDVPLRSHGSLALNRTLLAAGLVDRIQLTVFPVITGQTGAAPIFQNAADFDLELIEAHTLDGHTQELVYRPTRHS
ncbi:dihydrofolate reductase family protein [Actinoplanes sp. NPDC049265]|uniref:dihydrofolate reductase family protein n=1 Tax=Actinoplanes sp. NPDC049265 TaxID=3363902 RepID=UPI00371479E7